MSLKANRQALRVALIYVSVACGWILFSDEVVKWLVRDPDLRVTVSILKGWAFVLVTGGLLYLAVLRLLRWSSEAAEQSRRNEERYALAERAVNDGLWDWNIVTGEDIFSRRWKEIIGYQDHELPNLRSAFFNLLHPDDRELVQRVTTAHLEKGERYALEFRMRHKDGTWRWVFSRGEAVRDASGRPVRMVGAITDITDRKQSEATLRESEERYHLLFELESDAILLADQDTHQILEVNASAQRLYGYSRDEFVQLRLEDVSAEPEASRLSLANKERHVPLRWHRRKSGERFAAEITTSNFEHQGHTLKLSTVRDITLRKGAEEKLLESEEKFSKIFQSSPMPITLSTMNEGRYLDANEAFLKMVQRSHGEVVGRTALEIGVWADPSQRVGVIDQLKATGEVRNVGIAIRTPAGQIRQIVWSAEVVTIRGERCLLGTCLDVTERKEAEEKLASEQYLLNSLLGTTPDRIYFKDRESRFIKINRAFARLQEFPDVLGKTDFDIFNEEHARRAFEDEQHIMTTGEPLIDKEEREDWPDGHTSWVCSTKLPLFDSHGKITGIVGIGRDITKRKESEAALRGSEERFRLLWIQSEDGIRLTDASGTIVMANPAYCRLLGLPLEAVQGRLMCDVYLTENRPKILGDHRTNFMARSVKARVETQVTLWNGNTIWLEVSNSFMEHPGSEPLLLGLFRNVSERKRAEEQLQETTGQLLEAQQIAGLGSYVFEVATGFWSGSKVLGNIFGLVDIGLAHDMKVWLEIVHPEDRAEMQRYLRDEVLNNRRPFDRTYRIVRVNDQQERWVHCLGKLVLDGNGQVVRMVGVIQDITDRKHAEEQMNVQFSALTAAANAILIADRNGKIEWVNPAFSKLTGYSPEEAVGCPLFLLKSDQHPPAFYANIWSTVLTGNVWHGEIINRRKDGQLYTEEMTVTPVRSADGQIAHFVAIKQDVTEQRDLERRMLQTQKMEAIGTLAGGIAHDFNNILAAMFGFAYLLQQDTEGNAAAQENIEQILKATDRAKDLVQQILTFSRQREQKPQVIQLDTVVKEAIKFLRASLPAQIKIEMNLDAGTPLVLADPTQIYQVTVNLATNALHAMEGRPGLLTVNLDCFKADEKFVQSHPEFRPDAYARLTVADTGHGMDAKTLGRIFEPFFTTKAVGKGTGLGLAVVHGIVQSHNGVIMVDSQAGRGTTFHLYFPGRTRASIPEPVPESQTPPGAGQKILLLDDEPAITAALQRLLMRLNYRVTTSNSAREVIQWYRDDPAQFDLVITDLTMPEMDGLELTRQLHALRPGVPVILASGFCAELNRDNLKAAGIAELLEKPISKTDLARAIQRTLAGRNSHVAKE